MKRVSRAAVCGGFYLIGRHGAKWLCFPSPLAGEGGASRSEATGEGSSPRSETLIRRAEFIIGRRSAPTRWRATFSHKEEGRRAQLRRGQAAATASASQLTIRSVPPVGAASGNRLWPA